MIGLPYSGKTTRAKSMGHPIVSPDQIRIATYGRRYWSPGEAMVWAIAHIMVRSLFSAGHSNVILDACNNTKKRRDAWLCRDHEEPQWGRQFHWIDTPYEECIVRAKANTDSQIIQVIERMRNEFEPVVREEEDAG